MHTVWLERRKYPDHRHYDGDTTYLGQDEAGTWLALGPGREVFKSGELWRISDGPGGVMLIPRGEWYCAWFRFNRDFDLYVDIVTPPVVTTDVITMVDLDFDVIRFCDGRVELVDEDEFEEHRVLYGYPSELERRAREEAARIHAAVESRDEPFTWPDQKWIDLAVEAGCTAPV